MPMSCHFSSSFPVAKRVRRHAQILGGVRYTEIISQLGHSTDSASINNACTTLPKPPRVARSWFAQNAVPGRTSGTKRHDVFVGFLIEVSKTCGRYADQPRLNSPIISDAIIVSRAPASC